jgi:DNA-directed RNA polymerase I subunit RPA43
MFAAKGLSLKFPAGAMNRSPLAGKKRKNHPEHALQQPTPSRTKRDNTSRTFKDTTPRSSEFQQVEVSLVITLPPMFIGNPRSGIQDMLDSMLMQ